MDQLTLHVRWSDHTKRWVLTVEARTTQGPYRGSAVANEPYGVPMEPGTARAVLEYAVMAMEQQWPF